MKARLLIPVVVVFCLLSSFAYSETMVDEFVFPMNPWITNCNGFWGTCNIPASWHLGVDVAASEGDPVMASGNGVVKHVGLHSGYGHVVIIEHKLLSGEVVCSVSAHLKSNLSVTLNQEVNPGDVVGFIGSREENGGWIPHLHFGFKKGEFSLSGYNYVCNGQIQWGYGGYTQCSDQKSTWYNPQELISSYYEITTAIAKFPDGSTHHQILNRYNQSGGKDVVGWPHDYGAGIYVHDWVIQQQPTKYQLQNFKSSNGQESIIMYGSAWQHQAYRVHGEVWEVYRKGRDGYFGPDIRLDDGRQLGGPTSEYANGVQRFENGYYTKKFQNFIGETKQMSFKTASVQTQIVIELRELDGTLVETYYPTGEMSELTLTAKPVSDRQVVLSWLGGPVVDSYQVWRDGIHLNTTAVPEFTETNLTPGATYSYQVVAVSSVEGELQRSNEVSVVMSGAQASFTLQGINEGSSYAYLTWTNSSYNTPYHWVYRDGVLVSKVYGNEHSDFPLEPNTEYQYQIAAVTLSGITLGLSNIVSVTTEPFIAPPQADPVVSAVGLDVDAVWQVGDGGQIIATTYDQYGNEMTDVDLLFFSSDYSTFTVSGDDGICWAQKPGEVEVWAEVKAQRHIKSERVNVRVLDQLEPEPSDPDDFPLSGLSLEEFELITQAPYVDYFSLTWRAVVANRTQGSIVFAGTSLGIYNLSGQLLQVLPSLPSFKTLDPGQTNATAFSGWVSVGPGEYLVRPHVQLSGDGSNDWHWVGESTLPLSIVSSTDLRAELDLRYFTLTFPEGQETITVNDNVKLYVMFLNAGQQVVNTPFEVMVTLTGNGMSLSQSQTVGSMELGWPRHLYFDFGTLSAGSYKADCFVDVSNQVEEYDEADNFRTVIVEVQSPPTTPKLTLSDIPVYGKSSEECWLHGNAFDINPETHEVVAFIRLGGVWYHTQYPSLVSPIEADGSWAIDLFSSQNDYFANEFAVYAVPLGADLPSCWPEQCNVQPQIDSAVAMINGTLKVETPVAVPSDAKLRFKSVPVVGDAIGKTVLAVEGIDPADFHRYRVVVYSLVNVATPPWEYWRWYWKADMGLMVNPILPNGEVVCHLTQSPADLTATDIMAFLIIADAEVLACGDWLECGEYPVLTEFIDVVRASRVANPEWQLTPSTSSISVVEQESFIASWLVASVGQVNSPATELNVMFGGQSATIACPALQIGEQIELTAEFTTSIIGTFELTANLADQISVVQVTVQPRTLPDLMVSAVNVSRLKLFGRQYVLCYATVQNQGQAVAEQFHVELTAEAISWRVSRSVTRLDPGKRLTLWQLLPSRVNGQTITLKATADVNQVVTESDETNNTASVVRTL